MKRKVRDRWRNGKVGDTDGGTEQ
jgi:hypothetical protein